MSLFLQVVATGVDPDYYVRTVLSRFHVLELLTFSADDGNSFSSRRFIEREKQVPMLESALTFLCQIITLRNHLGRGTSLRQSIIYVGARHHVNQSSRWPSG